jgi:hypothetical protein
VIRRAPRPDSGYTLLRNDVLRDVRLSFRARGVLTYVLSNADNWRVSIKSLTAQTTEGPQALATALRELEAAGYLTRARIQDPDTGRWMTESVFYDTPQNDTKPGAPADQGAVTAPAKPTKPEDPQRTLAARVVRDVWEPQVKGRTSTPPVAVVSIVANALRNGVQPKRCVEALNRLAASGTTVTTHRFDEALNGAKPKGQLAADSATDWTTLAADATADGTVAL